MTITEIVQQCMSKTLEVAKHADPSNVHESKAELTKIAAEAVRRIDNHIGVKQYGPSK